MSEAGNAPRIRYDEGCLAAHALNLIGDRWALLVVRELVFAAKRFQMIRAGLPGITPSVLNGRLAQLRQVGVIDHDTRLGVYTLTDAGRALLPVLESLCRWALTVPGHDPTRFISPSALMISMGVTLIRDETSQSEALAGFDFGTEAFEMHLRAGGQCTRAVASTKAPVVFCGNGNVLASAVYGPSPIATLVQEGVIGVMGDLDLAQRFADRFRLRG